MKWKLLRQEERQQPTVAPGFRQSSQRCGWKGLLRGEASDRGQGLTLSIAVLEILLGPLSSQVLHKARKLTKHNLSPSYIQGHVHIKTISDFFEAEC